jgi:hypothetical protein
MNWAEFPEQICMGVGNMHIRMEGGETFVIAHDTYVTQFQKITEVVRREQAVVGLDWRIVAIRIGQIFGGLDFIANPFQKTGLDCQSFCSNPFFQSNPNQNYVLCVSSLYLVHRIPGPNSYGRL